MRDRITQVLLGTFVATFIYSVLVVRAIRGSDFSGGFVPAISVTVAIVLSVLSLVLLIFFIHHVSASIQASRIVRVISEDLVGAIPRLYPSETGRGPEEGKETKALRGRGRISVPVVQSGYLQTADVEGLLDLASERDLVIELVVKPGDHVVSGTEIAVVRGASALSKDDLSSIVSAFVIGGERTPAQDIRYQFQQLADVVIRALSPGINDPFTAINGIDELETAVVLLARRLPVAGDRPDKDSIVRLSIPVTGLSEILEDTVGHIAIYGAGDMFVMGKLRHLLDAVERELRDQRELETIARLRLELERDRQANRSG
jgi:uncharacterized membrane protein